MKITQRTEPETSLGQRRSAWLLVLAGAMAGAGFWIYRKSEGRRIEAVASSCREALAAGKLDKARERLTRWDELAPADGAAEAARALLEIKADRLAEALDAIRRAVDKGYPKEPVIVLRAVVQSRAGKYDEAEPVLRAAFEAGSEPGAEVAEGLARVYLKTFRLPETLRTLEAWRKLAPGDARPYLWKAEVDQRVSNDLEVLIVDYREALRRDPNSDEARLGLADRLREAAQIDEAEAEYATLLKHQPRNVAGLVGSGRIALLRGDLQAATKHLENALAVDPNAPDALRELALIDLRNGQPKRACERLARAVEADPFDFEVRFTYARALNMAGEKAKAAEITASIERLKKEKQQIDDLRQRLAEHPSDLDLQGKIARWLIEHGHDQEGLDWTALILREKPDHPETCRLLAEYHARKGNPGLANYYRALAPVSKATTKGL